MSAKGIINSREKRLKAKGKLFNRWFSYIDYKHCSFDFNLSSEKMLDKDYGDTFDLKDFIGDCEGGAFIDYDGHAREILLNGKVIWESVIYPSDLLFWKSRLMSLYETHNRKLEIVWYNR